MKETAEKSTVASLPVVSGKPQEASLNKTPAQPVSFEVRSIKAAGLAPRDTKLSWSKVVHPELHDDEVWNRTPRDDDVWTRKGPFNNGW